MKEKILYLMHVDWGWIKQRPHFIAEKLNKVYDVTVFYSFSRDRSVLTKNPTDVKKLPIVPLPMKRIELMNKMNIIIQRFYFAVILRVNKPKYIWVSHPSLFSYLPKEQIENHSIIYDCMDDVLEFSYTEPVKAELKRAEEDLLKAASIVFVSSENLRDKIIFRGCDSEKAVLVRNGYNGEVINPIQNVKQDKRNFRMAYIGTISDWVNFDYILDSLEHMSDIEYHFFGPIDCEVPKHERIFYRGSVKHNELYKNIQDFDCLLMPFKINELILSVDPVKLYEYINFNKNIISVYYEEIERFSDFVHFYQNTDVFKKNIQKLKEDNTLKYSEEQRLKFLSENTWDKRVEKVITTLNEKNGK